MHCLKNFIGIRQACSPGGAPAPRSRQYIESYPGITKAALQSIEPGVFLNAQAFLDACVEDALNTIVAVDLRTALEPYVRTREELEFGKVGQFDEELENAEAVARGLRITKKAGYMGALLVGRAWVGYDTAGTYVLTVTDGEKTDAFDVLITNPELPVEVFVQFETLKDRVDLTITPVAQRPHSGSTTEVADFRASNCDTCDTGGAFKMIKAAGLKDGVESEVLQGITADVAVTCDPMAAVCMFAPHIKVPIFYATVIKVLENWEATGRMNFFAQHKQEWVAQQWEYLVNRKYPEVWDLHSKGLAKYLAELDPICITCGTGTTYGYSRF